MSPGGPARSRMPDTPPEPAPPGSCPRLRGAEPATRSRSASADRTAWPSGRARPHRGCGPGGRQAARTVPVRQRPDRTETHQAWHSDRTGRNRTLHPDRTRRNRTLHRDRPGTRRTRRPHRSARSRHRCRGSPGPERAYRRDRTARQPLERVVHRAAARRAAAGPPESSRAGQADPGRAAARRSHRRIRPAGAGRGSRPAGPGIPPLRLLERHRWARRDRPRPGWPPARPHPAPGSWRCRARHGPAPGWGAADRPARAGRRTRPAGSPRSAGRG
ncbi:hypothetical protein FHX34_1011693 [Actinoplanes teichomyceticus]|uniref:Uncharacterized protein n=1 Tax=Actinoplanes teichomyceticus TaxID=1867 RepID=A0A561WS51_ACTTI|nr:hypothetical protein FHX34_1011693 [Actinoplanes teichomyceticus]